MDFIRRAGRAGAFAAIAAIVMAGAAPVSAQELAASHISAARAAISAIRATDEFDAILPQAAATLKGELIQKDPHLVALINATVDKHAIALAARRGDLEREAALAYARAFSEAELNSIAQFYGSEAGQKLLQQGPIVTGEVIQAANIWQRGLARDLAEAVATELQAAAAAMQPAPAPAAEGEGAETPAQ